MKLSEEQRRHVGDVAEQFHLSLVLLFGSAVAEKAMHSHSDLDIAVLVEGRLPELSAYSDLRHALQEVFPEYEVDLALINHADPLFLKKITEQCQLLYGEPRRLAELKIYAYKRYHDHRRYFEMERAYVDRFLKAAAQAE
ncbi:MAG: nucleotidyltransferase domain-containing protein [Nitrospirota bacterium]